jgi:transcription termination factor Rho
MTAQALEQSALESKDKEQLLAIAKALGLKATARLKKSEIISQILDTTSSGPPSGPSSGPPESASASRVAPDQARSATSTAQDSPVTTTEPAVVEPPSEWELEFSSEPVDGSSDALSHSGANGGAGSESGTDAASGEAARGSSERRGDGAPRQARSTQPRPGTQNNRSDDAESRSSRRRRRRKKTKAFDGPQGEDRDLLEDETETPASTEPLAVEGYVDLRDEGYGFLRLKGFLPSRDDPYVPLKLSRQFGLRKGDHVTGVSRPAGRNEKNPALLEVTLVNGGSPEVAKRRSRFEDLTALFPDQRMYLENPADPADVTARIIDLVAPIGKGQRGIIVSPPKAGKTTVMKTIATAIERNNPEVKMMVLLIDERPEEVTDMRRSVAGEVIASTFDRPSDEHTHAAEMTIERAKRLVEMGEDVVIILDGITRLSRAYNLAAPASGRILSGGIDAGALYPPKKFFGAARNIEEGGSLTILATALVETNSRMDDAIFEEFKGTGNMELRLDRKLAERRIYPAIDVDASSTRHEELLFDRKQLQMVWKLRRVLSGLAAEGNAAPGLELLIDRLKTFRTNDEFLNEIAKQPTM